MNRSYSKQDSEVFEELEADHVYILMKKDNRISRNFRAQWYFNNLNKTVQFQKKINWDDCKNELEIISIIPKDSPNDWDPETSHLYQYRITPSTVVTFLAHKYRFVFCLDLSPSIAVVEIQRGEVLFDEVFQTLKKCLEGLTKSFCVPGSLMLCQPQVYITVIAHSPLHVKKNEQVLIQGWLLTQRNLDAFLEQLHCQLLEVEDYLAEAAQNSFDYLHNQKLLDKAEDSSLEESIDENLFISTTKPDTDFINLLRYGILSLYLLPENSCGGIIVITDGIISLRDINMLDTLLMQLRNSTTSCSFLQLGSHYHPHCCKGYVPYVDLMQFIATATYGAYLPTMPEADQLLNNEMNCYHSSFFTWSFQRSLLCLRMDSLPSRRLNSFEWTTDNSNFFYTKEILPLRKKHKESNIPTSLDNVLSCRLREGYIIKEVLLKDNNHIQIVLVLFWRHNVNIEYTVTSLWPTNPSNQSCHYEITIEGNYEFLHDVTCPKKEPFKSIYRTTVVKKYLALLQGLSQTDQLLVHLQSFANNSINYDIPESIKRGMPLFNLPPNTTIPDLYSSDIGHAQFQNFWKTVCMLDINIWQKWMHTHRIGIILEHDQPMPKYLHLTNSLGRYQVIQCRQAMAALTSLLTEWSSFVLIENHSYIKFIYKEQEKPPVSFYIIRLTSKPPCMVIKLAFLGGMHGNERNKVVSLLREKILSLTFPQRPALKENPIRKGPLSWQTDRTSDADTPKKAPLQRGSSQINCCVLMMKPVETILIRYEKMPTDFLSLITRSENLSQSKMNVNNKQFSAFNMFTMLSHYLHHRRWIWSLQNGPFNSISAQAVARVLGTLVKMRLQEGFTIAHSHSGILNLVMEVKMKVPQNGSATEISKNEDDAHYGVIQYVLFPPHTTTTSIRESISEEEDGENEMENTEADGELQLISECWVEPLTGVVTDSSFENKHFEGRTYKELAKFFYPTDLECISSIVTFEHLSLLCQNTNAPTPVVSVPSHEPLYTRAGCSVDIDAFIQYVPFSFDIMKLLPRCQQSELLFSTYIQSLNYDYIPVDVSGDSLDEIDTPNQLLMELLYENLANIHDREIYLTSADNQAFPIQVTDRERDIANYPLPFLRSQVFDNRTVNEGNINTGEQFSPKFQPSNSFSRRSNDNEDKDDSTPVKEHCIPRWKCFVKAVSSTHLILTFIPASFLDLKLLNISRNPDVDTHTVKYIFNDIETELSSSISSQKTPSLIQSPKVPNSNEDKTIIGDGLQTPKKLSGLSYPNGSVILPIYVYDCPLAGISNQLIYKNLSKTFKDNFSDLTFKHELEQGEDTVTLKSETQSSESSKQPSPEPRSEESSATNRRMQLQQHCNIIEMAFSKCFVVGIFRSLHLNHHIHRYDVQSAVDNICEESLLEVDITNFIQTVCGHLKDFKVKSALEQLRLGTQDVQQMKSFIKKSHSLGTLSGSEMEKEVEPRRGQKFPLTLLQLTQTCEDLQKLHVLIKEKFSVLLSKSFLPVSANPDYFFYCPPNFQRHRSKTDITLDDEGEVHSIISDDEHETETFRSETVEFRSDQGSTSILSRKHSIGDGDLPVNQETGTRAEKGSLMSLVSNIDSESMASYIGDDIGLNEDGDDNIPPLFIHLTCTVRVKNSVGSFSIRSLPTCLGEIVSCLENPGCDLDLRELQVTLDIICLTLPPDMDLAFTEKNKNLRTTSFCSTSPTPADHSLPVDEIGSAQSSSDDEFPSETQGDQLSHLPIFQHNAVTTSIEEIKWMLRDEIASAMLDSIPLTEGTLDMVASHVHSSPERPGCVIEEVPLQFVFGAEHSLDKFIQEFRQMVLTGYHLNQEGDFYYLVRNNVTSPKQIGSSNQPSLSLARKFLIVQTNPHADDGTELRKIGTGTNEASILTRETDKIRDDVQVNHLNTVSATLEGRRSPRRSKHHDSVDVTEEDTETEDGCKKIVEMRSKRTNRSSKEKDILFKEEQLKTSPIKNSSVNIAEHEINDISSNNKSIQDLNNPWIWVQEDASAAHSDNLSPQENSGNPLPKSESSTSLQLIDNHNDTERILDISPARKAANLSQVSRKLELSTPFSTPGPSDVSSLMGSGQCSNTEDGYDGDSSNSDNECDWLNDLDTRFPQLPKFWLILKVFQDRVNVYFHVRDPEQKDEQLLQWKEVYRQVIRNIKNICKVVNQSLLLQDLHETRMCNRLLEPEAVEDIWKHDDLSIGNKKEYQRILSNDDPDLDTGSEYQDSYLKANLDFMPGAFSCNIVWQTHFVLHPRLKTGPGPGRSGVSRGIQALRTVLNAFSVNNRVNMFVYQESSGSVFYLRLNESQCPVLGNHTIDSAPGSCSSSLLALPIKKSATDGEEELSDSRPRVNSVDRDSLSVMSRNSGRQQKMEDSIQLLVHGIAEASYEIKKELVEVLQNRLDEAVLDVISITLTRNPMCKLTPEDVQFIQRPQELPKTIQFTIHAQALPYLQAVSCYLRQNLLQFLHIPKYIDSKTENHFQDYNPTTPEEQPMRDFDMFLYTRSRSSGNIGIACLTFSIVDGQGNPVQQISCSKPSLAVYKDGISTFEFDALTSTELYSSNSGSSKHPGPVALIQFRIWERGKVDFDHLSDQLKNAVRHALWDVVMEYHLLAAPLSEVPLIEDSVIYSEPATPVKELRSKSVGGAPMFLRPPIPTDSHRQTRLPNTALVKERVPSPISLVQVKFRELSSSVPDIIIKSRSPLTSPKETTSAIKVYNSSGLPSALQGSLSVPTKKEPEIQLAVEAEMLQSVEKVDFEDKGKLHPVYSETMQHWLEYAFSLSVPSVKKHTLNLVSRYPIDLVLYEFQSQLSNIADMSPKTFYKVLLDEEECYVPYTLIRSAVMPRERKMESSPEESPLSSRLPNSGKNYIMIACDENQRRASVNDELVTELFPVNLNANKGNQKYPPIFQSTVSLDRTDGVGISTLSSSTPVSATTPGNSSLISNPLSHAYSDSSNTVFIPRQRILFVTVNNKELCMYMYNWAKDPTTTILKSITRLIQWHNARSSVLTSIITQKMGLFHNQDFARRNFKNKVPEKDPQMNNVYISSASDIDSLIKYVAPPHRESASGNLGIQRRSHHANHFTNQSFLDILKDNKPSRPIQKTAYGLICDPVLKHGNQIQEIRHMDQKEQQKKLCTMLQISGAHGSTSLTEDLLQLFKQVARLEHYCLTPLLFMPQWRWQVAAARDHTIQALPIPAPDLVMRSRHNSGSSIKGFADLKGRRQSVNLPIMQSMQSSPKTLINRSVCEEVWYTPLCSNYIHEFTVYLQNLGFATVQIRSTSPKRSMKGPREAEDEIHTSGRTFSPPIMGRQISNYYMQKSHLGGLIILELSIIEPYFCVRMYILETARIRHSGPYNSQFALGFLDDCDKLKVLIHLHSFTYDYHLRSIHSYISGRQLIFRQGYHLTSFLEDFVKYYQKSPSFSWNLIYQGILTIPDTSTPATQLYNYLLTHDKLYGMCVLRMIPVHQNDEQQKDNEYVLVQLTTQKVTYKDINETSHTDDFDVSLLISHDNSTAFQNEPDQNVLSLKFYIILTSRREIYPRVVEEKKLGKFRTITTATPVSSRKVSLVSIDRSELEKGSTPCSSRRISLTSSLLDSQQLENSVLSSTVKEESSSAPLSTTILSTTPSIHIQHDLLDSSTLGEPQMSSNLSRNHLGIRQEAVNYLGYFSTTEEMMNQIMLEQATAATERIRNIIDTAMVHCRRDSLWQRLLVGVKENDEGKRKKDDNKDLVACGLAYSEFTELLKLITIKPLNDIDNQLLPFLSMHISWYQSLVRVLINKYTETQCRHFVDPEGSTQHVAVLNPNFLDTFMLFSVEPQFNRATLCAAFREPITPSNLEHTPERPSFQGQAYQSLVEGFVNACCFHLWSCML